MQFNKHAIRVFALTFFSLSLILYGCNQTDIAISDPIPNCFDGIVNQGEYEVDCGGPCQDCLARMDANINGQNWMSQGGVSTQINNNSIIISSGNNNSNISLIYTGPFVNGNFNLSGGLYSTSNPTKTYTTNTGSISFTQWDNNKKLLYGTFSFTAFETSGSGDSVKVTLGNFSFVKF